ncbi:hypothetical protein V2A60_007245 [Cordyceps javanica]
MARFPFQSYLASGLQETPEFEEDDDDLELEAERERAEKLFKEYHDPALDDPANFKPPFDEDEVIHEIKYLHLLPLDVWGYFAMASVSTID